jgi:hypothetical protein
LRKYLIAAVAALTVVAFAAVASAQAPPATMKVTVKPRDAGTLANPKNSSIKFKIVNNDNTRTMSKLTIRTPRTFKLTAKGLTKCDEHTLETRGPSACPDKSRVGKGVAHALLGVGSANPTPLTFDVTAVVLGAKRIAFHLKSRELPDLQPVAMSRLSKGKLTIVVPDIAQQPFPGTYAGRVSLEAKLKGKQGKHKLASTTGCKAHKHKFSATMTFIDNGVSEAGTVTTKGASACTK